MVIHDSVRSTPGGKADEWKCCSAEAAGDKAGFCWPPGLRSDEFRSFLSRGRARCKSPQRTGSVVLSLMMPEPLEMAELCGDRPVSGFFNNSSGKQLPTHGQPAYQRAKAILYVWAHLVFAHVYMCILYSQI
jgi:hypothetical protein